MPDDETSAGQEARLSEQMATLDAKLDRIGGQLDALTQRQRAMQELRADMGPVLHEAYSVVVRELSALDGQVTLDDLMGLGLKLLRNARTLSGFFDQLTSIHGLYEDFRPLGREMLDAATDRLQDLERRGHFTLLREAGKLLDKLAATATPEDLKTLGENLPVLLEMLRVLTQPELLQLAQRTLATLQRTDIEAPKGVLGLLRALRDDDVRHGMGIALTMLKQLRPAPQGAS